MRPDGADPQVSASELAKRRGEAVAVHPDLRAAYLEEFDGADGSQAFLNAVGNYPLLKGSQTNLYKCFLPQAWRVASDQGCRGSCIRKGSMTTRRAVSCGRCFIDGCVGHFQFENEYKLLPRFITP